MPSTSVSRPGGAASTSAKVPKRFRSSLAIGFTSRRGMRPEQHEFEQLVIGKRVAADLDEAGAQSVAVAVIVGRIAAAAHARVESRSSPAL